MADQTLNLAVLLKARKNEQSRMTASPFQLRVLVALAAVGLSAIAFFAPASVAADKTTVQMKAAPVAPKVAASTVKAELLQPSARSTELLSTITTNKPARKPKLRTMRMLVTAYCPCTKCCGANAQGITASGKSVSHNQGRFVAADKKLFSFGTKLVIPGYHNETPVEVLDTGSAIKGNRIDVYYPTHQRALEWGKQWVDVVVLD